VQNVLAAVLSLSHLHSHAPPSIIEDQRRYVPTLCHAAAQPMLTMGSDEKWRHSDGLARMVMSVRSQNLIFCSGGPQRFRYTARYFLERRTRFGEGLAGLLSASIDS